MTLFPWKSDLDLGVAAMDREHRELVAAMNVIHALHIDGAPTPKLDAAMERLTTLTRQHFANEERHLAAIEFPGLKVHARTHSDLLARLAAHHQRFAKGCGYLPREFFDFLVLWLSAHILCIDGAYAEHRTPAKI